MYCATVSLVVGSIVPCCPQCHCGRCTFLWKQRRALLDRCDCDELGLDLVLVSSVMRATEMLFPDVAKVTFVAGMASDKLC